MKTLIFLVLFLIHVISMSFVYGQTQDEGVEFFMELGLTSFQNQQFEEAISYYDKVLEIDPKYVLALNNKGMTLEQLGKFEEAISYYDKVLEIDHDDSFSLERILQIYQGTEPKSTKDSDYKVSAQTQIRNSLGYLVCVVEPEVVNYIPFSITDKFLDSIKDKSMDVINDKKLEILKIRVTYRVSDLEIFQSETRLYFQYHSILIPVFRVYTDACAIENGDVATTLWQISRYRDV